MNALQVPQQGNYGQRCPFPAPASNTSHDKTKFHLSLKLPVKGAPLHVPPRVTQRREMLSLRRQWFILSLISLSPQLRSPSTKWRKNIRSPSKEPHVYNGVRPGSPRGSLMTLQSLPHCHVAFSDTFHFGLGRPEAC